MSLTAPQKLKQWIIAKTFPKLRVLATPEEIDEIWEADTLGDEDDVQEALRQKMDELRSGEHNTELPADYNRHYESRAVASEMLDGTYVGWTYWYGGGKHGEPEAMEWVEDAYDVEMTQETRVVCVFKRADSDGRSNA